MNAWAADFDNWDVCDSLLQPAQPDGIRVGESRQWTAGPREFVKRAGFALMARLTLHDKAAPDRRSWGSCPSSARATSATS